MKTKRPPIPSAPPKGAWSLTRNLGPFHKDSHFCGHCKCEIPPGGKLWYKHVLVLCSGCVDILFPQYKN